jgi:hypothetical protein
MTTWILSRNILLSLLAAKLLSACLLPNDSMATSDKAVVTLSPQTPNSTMEDNSSCRLRDEIPFEGITSLSLPELDVQALLTQDQNLPKDAPFRFAISTEVHIDPSSDGTWQAMDNFPVWRLKIISPKARSLSLGFTTYDMPAQGCLFVFSPDRRQILGPYTHADNAEHGQLWTPVIEGEEVLIELSVPKDKISQLQLVLGIVNQGYKE